MLVWMMLAFSPATHMYLASQTFQIWQSVDPDFYNALTGSGPYTMNKKVQVMTRKFYYLGATLPDLLDPLFGQEYVRKVILSACLLPRHVNVSDTFKVIEDGFFEFGARVRADIMMDPRSPLYIPESICELVETTRLHFFDWVNAHDPNKLYQMVQYAMSHNWSPEQKALIYGAYVHVVQDFLAHSVLQPSLFGYARTLESPKAQSLGLLQFPEAYYELLVQTYIPEEAYASFLGDLFRYFQSTVAGDASYSNLRPSWGELLAPLQVFMAVVPDLNGGEWHVNIMSPEFRDLPPLAGFREAAEAVGYVSDTIFSDSVYVTYFQVLLHGWGIVLWGFYRDDGGLFGHPSRTLSSHLLSISTDAMDGLYTAVRVDIDGYAGAIGGWVIQWLLNHYIGRVILFPFSWGKSLTDVGEEYATRALRRALRSLQWGFSCIIRSSTPDEADACLDAVVTYVCNEIRVPGLHQRCLTEVRTRLPGFLNSSLFYGKLMEVISRFDVEDSWINYLTDTTWVFGSVKNFVSR